ncbi:MAG: hypothetical protein COB35_13805 [Gammaproteobacteria bacterium]|nr:MAG: hypothetical protein COB35_13805 [Gammaproteobacteria bacterium]
MKQLLCLILITFSLKLAAVQLTIVSEDLPPLQMNNHEKPASGAMVDVVHLLLKEAELSAQLQFYPWARSYKIAQTQKNTLIFSMFRDPSREKYFQWIGKIFTLESFLVALKSRNDIQINQLNDAKKYLVGSIRDDLAETYLTAHGFKEKQNLYLNSAYPALWKIFFNGRTDIAFTNSTWAYEIKNTGLDPNKIKVLYKIPNITSDLYIAASLNTDKTMVIKLKKALATIKADGRYQKILTKWHL